MLVCRLKNFCCKAKSLKALGLLYSFSQSWNYFREWTEFFLCSTCLCWFSKALFTW
jgi:hypothetical protein